MYIVDIIPATKIPIDKSQIYTYYSPRKIKKGVLVMAEIYRRKVLGIVVNVQNLEKRKIEVKQFPYQLKEILEVVDPNPILASAQIELAKWIAEYYCAPLGLVVKNALPEIPKKPARIATRASELSQNTVTIDEFAQSTNNIVVGELARLRSVAGGKKIIQSIKDSKNKKFLLFNLGETKEKIYLGLLKKFTKNNKQTFILFPEISELKKTIFKLSKFLNKSEIAVLSSDFSKTVYWQEWQKIKTGKAKIIFGTRVALFAPFKKLGLIIVDNEQSASYKSDRAPRYQAKKIAIKLAKISKSKIILQSDTPSIESYYFTKQKEYKLIIRNSKFEIRNSVIIDMKEEARKENYSIFSEDLIEKIKKALEEKKQAILFTGRRGMANFIMCRDCGYLIKCPNCNVPLIHHIFGKTEALICHHCNHQESPPPFCPKCSGYRIKYSGIGTEKVEAQIKKLFPKIKISRLDSDVAKNKKQENKICRDFVDKKIDILIGTQIILKNQDFQNIGLVGIVSIDSILNLPDFKSGERIFEIITKLLKLSKSNKADFILQTYHFDNSVIQFAIKNDFENFYKNEIKDREALAYPPFSDLIKLIYKNQDLQKCKRNSKILADKLKNTKYPPATLAMRAGKILNTKYEVMGPAPAFISKERGRYIWQIIIKMENENKPAGIATPAAMTAVKLPACNDSISGRSGWQSIAGKEFKNQILKLVPNDWIIDVDPENLL